MNLITRWRREGCLVELTQSEKFVGLVWQTGKGN